MNSAFSYTVLENYFQIFGYIRHPKMWRSPYKNEQLFLSIQKKESKGILSKTLSLIAPINMSV